MALILTDDATAAHPPPPPPPPPPKQVAATHTADEKVSTFNSFEENTHYKLAKSTSFDLVMEIQKYAKETSSPTNDTITISKKTLQEWAKRIKMVNKSATRLMRSANAANDRRRTDFELLKFALTNDVLDREATYTATLEHFARNSQPNKSKQLQKALRFVSTATLNPFGASKPSNESIRHQASKCQRLLDSLLLRPTTEKK